jgi:hypothetical protein
MLENEGLNFCDEHGQKILQAAVEKYFTKDPSFKQRVLNAKREFEKSKVSCELVIKSIQGSKVTVKSGVKPDTRFLDRLKDDID